jgi:hypothetical protein
MSLSILEVLIGLRLSIVRRAADMLVLHFGKVAPYKGGTIGEYALHIQCPWRFDGPNATITARNDYYEYDGPGAEPEGYWYDDGPSLQDNRFDSLIGRRELATNSWMNQDPDRFIVTSVRWAERGDISIQLSDGYEILVFPASSNREAWRFFAPGKDGEHEVFPNRQR